LVISKYWLRDAGFKGNILIYEGRFGSPTEYDMSNPPIKEKELVDTRNVVEKFKDFFTALTNDEQRDLYDIMVMVRGPDHGGDSSKVKEMITARIRYLFGIVDRSYNGHFRQFIPSSNSVPFPSYQEILMKARGIENYHYQSHAMEALKRLHELGIIKSDTKDC